MNPTKTIPPKLRELDRDLEEEDRYYIERYDCCMDSLEEQEFSNYPYFQGTNEMRDIIVYEFINENQYYLKSIIDQTRN